LTRTLDTDMNNAREAMRLLAAAGIDIDDVGLTLEDQGVASFHQSFQDVLGALDTKAHHLVTG
jgi:transaldolase